MLCLKKRHDFIEKPTLPASRIVQFFSWEGQGIQGILATYYMYKTTAVMKTKKVWEADEK